MATTIEERAKEIANEWRRDNAYGLVEDYINKALTEQDHIARAEEREKAIHILRQLGVFDMLAAEEGVSAACIEEQFKQTMEGGNNGN